MQIPININFLRSITSDINHNPRSHFILVHSANGVQLWNFTTSWNSGTKIANSKNFPAFLFSLKSLYQKEKKVVKA